jgi:uncharacterized OsmC-like protein
MIKIKGKLSFHYKKISSTIIRKCFNKSYFAFGEGLGLNSKTIFYKKEMDVIPNLVSSNDAIVVRTALPHFQKITIDPQPVELLLGALIGCETATAAFISRNMKPKKMNIKRLSFNYKAERNELGSKQLPIDVDPPVTSMLLSITGEVTVYISHDTVETEERLKLLQKQTNLRYCYIRLRFIDLISICVFICW